MDNIKCNRCESSEFFEKNGHFFCSVCGNVITIPKQELQETVTEAEPEAAEPMSGESPASEADPASENETTPEAEAEPEPASEPETDLDPEVHSLSPETYRIVNNYIKKRRRKRKRVRRANIILGIIVLLLLLWVILSFLMKYGLITFVPQEFSMFSVFQNLAASWNELKNAIF